VSSLGQDETLTVVTPEGRHLTVSVTGAPHGSPVVLLHGTPGSRNGPKPRGPVLYRLGVRLISYDRPGYGGSTPRHGRTVADAAKDVTAIVDALGDIDRFAVVGRSGGGPHALACAALLPERVTRTAVLVSFARPDAIDLDWFAGMSASNVTEFSAVETDLSDLIRRISEKAARTQQDPESLVRALEDEMTATDRQIVNDIGIRRLLTATYTEALRCGPDGWIDDVVALRRHWGFAFSSIAGPVRLWHGTDDTFAPVSHTKWLAGRIKHAELVVKSGAAHFSAVEVLPETLHWLVHG
jgi:pimeloyl-ACP methyl ester carboxylesterase